MLNLYDPQDKRFGNKFDEYEYQSPPIYELPPNPAPIEFEPVKLPPEPVPQIGTAEKKPLNYQLRKPRQFLQRQPRQRVAKPTPVAPVAPVAPIAEYADDTILGFPSTAVYVAGGATALIAAIYFFNAKGK